MRLLRRNTTKFEYLPYTGNESDLNDDGEHTGDYEPVYGSPVEYRGNISAPSGQTKYMGYGEDVRYTHTLLMDNPDVPINEYGAIRWKGEMYDIVAIHPSLNVFSAALRKQTKNHAVPEDAEGESQEADEEPCGAEDAEGE